MATSNGNKFRYGIVYSDNWTEVAAYLPMHYKVLNSTEKDGDDCLLIAGEDVAGWTLDGYIIPRLGSGMIHCEEITPDEFLKIISE